ncbi:hypothetical protein DL96DRAFT_1620875 [Flagelloscypha sp. PMI_526]|nr:hypothetical protein DL96DRAFT_1620875 [Flagelloscypha sp. PMI_526]
MSSPGLLPMELYIKVLQIAALESSHAECAHLMLISKAFYDVICDIVYRTIILRSARLCDGFTDLITSKPSSFFTHRTRALYMFLVDGSRSTQWHKLWTIIVPRLPSLLYLETCTPFPYSPLLQGTAINTIASLDGLTFLTLDRGLTTFITSLINKNESPIFSHLTHLKLLFLATTVEEATMLIQSQTFPALTHLMLPTGKRQMEGLAQSFSNLKVVIFIIAEVQRKVNPWFQTLPAQFPNIIIGDLKSSLTSNTSDPAEVFLGIVRGDRDSVWNHAEREIALRIQDKKELSSN